MPLHAERAMNKFPHARVLQASKLNYGLERLTLETKKFFIKSLASK